MPRKRSHQARVEKKAKKAAKNDRRRHQRDSDLPMSFALLSGLDEAEELLREGNVEDACEVLEELARRYPRRLEVLGLLLDTYLDLDDHWSYQAVCQKLILLIPDQDYSWLALLGAALLNGQFATAYRAADHFLKHCPNHQEADQTRELRDELEGVLQSELVKWGMSPDEGVDLLLLHDEIGLALHLGEYNKVIQTAERLLARCPTFAPALNNRSEAHFRSGSLDRAIADARHVLGFDADNCHALANLARYLFLNGAAEEAHAVAEKLKAVESDQDDLFVKLAETLGILGDWHGILDVLRQAKQSRIGDLEGDLGLVYHLAGVAAAELGQHAEARKHWKRAIKLQSTAEWSQSNLDDSKLPPGEQSGPWAFPLPNWISFDVLEQLTSTLERNGETVSNPEARRQVRKFFVEHPYLEKLVPVLLERVDPGAKGFIAHMASIAGTPPLQSALRDFAFGRRGTDMLRHDVAAQLVEAQVIEPGSLKMWIKGELREVVLTSMEIFPEPKQQYPKEDEKRFIKVSEAIHEGNGVKAQALIEELLQQYPDDLSLQNNRAAALQLQGRTEEAMFLIRELHARHPDYLFARTSLAQEATRQRNFVTVHGSKP